MSLVPILVAAVLLVLAFAFGLHCLVLHCDQRRQHERPLDHESSPFKPA
jgi:hypothetical protein